MTSIVLDIRDVHARYGKHEVLRGVSLQIRTGQWFCLLGPNGVGKSTLLHCVAGRLVPSAGDILVCGHSVRTQTVDAKRKLGFGCAPEQLPGLLTGRQCLEVYANAKGLERIDPEVVELGDGAEVQRLSRPVRRHVFARHAPETLRVAGAARRAGARSCSTKHSTAWIPAAR